MGTVVKGLDKALASMDLEKVFRLNLLRFSYVFPWELLFFSILDNFQMSITSIFQYLLLVISVA